MKDNRHFLRLSHHANINITFANGETMKAHTKNMSDDGLYVECPNHPLLKSGEIAEIVVIGIEGAIPCPVKIIRIDCSGGFAVQFV